MDKLYEPLAKIKMIDLQEVIQEALQIDELHKSITFLLKEKGEYKLLSFQLFTDYDDQPFEVSIPMSVFEGSADQEIIVKIQKHKIDLFFGGVLMDEEWLLGKVKEMEVTSLTLKLGLRQSVLENKTTPCGINLWNRALSDEEIIALSGGNTEVDKNMIKFLGKDRDSMQYWKPLGQDSGAGDCMPFYHEGRFHLFYLFDRHHHGSKRGLGAHQWAHMSSEDLITWQHHEMAVSITEQWEGSICTGSLFYNEGLYYAFYAVRMSDHSGAKLTCAVSRDCIHFEKMPDFITLKYPYEPVSARDPVVFKSEEDGLFHMLVTTELQTPSILGRNGCLAHLVSKDLKNWEQREPFIVSGYNSQPECPDYFFWKGWYYLIFSNDGLARYRMSKNPSGPWIKPSVDILDCPQWRVTKTAAYKDNRRIGVGFLNESNYGGRLIFREINQMPDGTLWTSFPKEMTTQYSEENSISFGEVSGQLSVTANVVKISSKDKIGIVEIRGLQRGARLSLQLEVKELPEAYGFYLSCDGYSAEGYELKFEPHRQKVSIRKARENSIIESEYTSIYNVDMLDSEITLELIISDDLLDVCIDGKRTLMRKLDIEPVDRLFFYTQGGTINLRY